MQAENETLQIASTVRVVREELLMEATSPGLASGQSYRNSNDLILSKVTLNPGSL